MIDYIIVNFDDGLWILVIGYRLVVFAYCLLITEYGNWLLII